MRWRTWNGSPRCTDENGQGEGTPYKKHNMELVLSILSIEFGRRKKQPQQNTKHCGICEYAKSASDYSEFGLPPAQYDGVSSLKLRPPKHAYRQVGRSLYHRPREQKMTSVSFRETDESDSVAAVPPLARLPLLRGKHLRRQYGDCKLSGQRINKLS